MDRKNSRSPTPSSHASSASSTNSTTTTNGQLVANNTGTRFSDFPPPVPKRTQSLNSHVGNNQPFYPTSSPLAPLQHSNSETPVMFDFPITLQSAPMQSSPSSTSQAGPSRAGRSAIPYTGIARAPTIIGASLPQLEAKVVILGSQGVGKTSIVHRYTSGHFSYSLSSTIGASFLTKKLVVDSCKVRLQIWDTAGQERFRSMAPLYYRGALAAILVYDITNKDSFEDVKVWLEELRRNMSPDLVIHIVGSKGDLATTHREVDLLYAQRSVAEWSNTGTTEAAIPATSKPSPSPSLRETSPSPAPGRPRARTLSTRGTNSLLSVPSQRYLSASPAPSPPPSSYAQQLGGRERKKSSRGIGKSPFASTGNLAAILTGTLSSPLSISEEGESAVARGGNRGDASLGLGSSSRGKSFEEEVRPSATEVENERVAAMIQNCDIEITEVSAKDDYGIEDLFFHITSRLVERKTQIEANRVLRSRDSFMLANTVNTPEESAGSWCC